MKSNTIAALAACAGLVWGSAHAAPGSTEAMGHAPEVIVLELQPMPGVEPGSEQEQAILGMLLLQLLAAMQAEGETVEVQLVPPEHGQRI